jgi:hypothetical protein
MAESAIEFVDYGDVRVDCDGVPIERCGFVAPVAHGVESRLIKHGVAFEDLQGTNRAVGTNEGVEFDATFTTSLTGQRGENRLDTMDQEGGVDVGDVHDARCGSLRDYGLNTTFANKLGASGAFWTCSSAFDDICTSEVVVPADGASGLRMRHGHYRRTGGAKRKLVSAGDVRLTWGRVIRSGVTVGRHGHHIREGDARSFGQDGDQN